MAVCLETISRSYTDINLFVDFHRTRLTLNIAEQTCRMYMRLTKIDKAGEEPTLKMELGDRDQKHERKETLFHCLP